jgi:hypothetical protein
MCSTGAPRFRLLGVPIRVGRSWLIILALVTWTLAGLFHEQVPGLAVAGSWALGLVGAVALFLCLLVHELGGAPSSPGRPGFRCAPCLLDLRLRRDKRQ